MKTTAWLLAALAATCPAWAGAQTVPTATPDGETTTTYPIQPAVPTGTDAEEDCCRFAAGTQVQLEIAEPLSSATRKRGDRFTIRLLAPLSRGDSVAVPAGTTGVGEIVHGERSRGGGKPGEMLLAARYLEFAGVRIALRGLKFGGQGQDKSNAALGASFALGPFAHFIRGKEIEIPAGTMVTAKLAEDLILSDRAPVAPATESPTPEVPAPSNTQE